MLVFDVTDHTGEKTRHLAVDKNAAIQAHFTHLGLLGMNPEPTVSKGVPLSEFKENRNTICWDIYCCVAGSEGKVLEVVPVKDRT